MSDEISHQVSTVNESPASQFRNIAVSIFIPVMILKYSAKWVGPEWALAVLALALSFPITSGVVDYLRDRRKNWIAILGALNALFTGVLAILNSEGIWFALKEAVFPFLIGVFILFTLKLSEPFVHQFLLQSKLLNWPTVHQRLTELDAHKAYHLLMKRVTIFLSCTFFISALLNFLLGIWIFQEIDLALPPEERRQILNDQIADMTWKGMLILTAPSMLMMFWILHQVDRGLARLTGLPRDSYLRQ